MTTPQTAARMLNAFDWLPGTDIAVDQDSLTIERNGASLYLSLNENHRRLWHWINQENRWRRRCKRALDRLEMVARSTTADRTPK